MGGRILIGILGGALQQPGHARLQGPEVAGQGLAVGFAYGLHGAAAGVAHDHDDLRPQVLDGVFGGGQALQIRRVPRLADGEEAARFLVEEKGIGHPAVRAGDDHGEGCLALHQGRAHGGVMAGVEGADPLARHEAGVALAELGEGGLGGGRIGFRRGGGVGWRGAGDLGRCLGCGLGLGGRRRVLVRREREAQGEQDQGQGSHGGSRQGYPDHRRETRWSPIWDLAQTRVPTRSRASESWMTR